MNDLRFYAPYQPLCSNSHVKPYASNSCKIELRNTSEKVQTNVSWQHQNENMTIILGYSTAVEYWRSCALIASRRSWRERLGDSARRKSATLSAHNCSDDPRAKEHAKRYLASDPHAQLILIGENPSHQIRGSNVHTHRSIPPRSFMAAPSQNDYEQVLVSVPEFCFLQMASLLPIEKLIAFGFELCGSYARSSQGTLFGTRPLTTPRKLAEFLSRATGFHGIKQAKRALRYILPRSASPMETALTMQLCLPYLLGGYGLPKPKLNKRIDLPSNARKQAHSSFYVCDLYWENEALAIEYDSDFAHAGINKTVQDALRRSILTGVGISVLSVTWAQVLDADALNKIAHIIANNTGKRLRCNDPSFPCRRQRLRSLVLPLRMDGEHH